MKTIKELINAIEATKVGATYTTNSGKVKELATLDQVSSRLQGLLVGAKIAKIIDNETCNQLMKYAKQANTAGLLAEIEDLEKAPEKAPKKAVKKADKKGVNDDLIRQLIEQNEQLINLLNNR